MSDYQQQQQQQPDSKKRKLDTAGASSSTAADAAGQPQQKPAIKSPVIPIALFDWSNVVVCNRSAAKKGGKYVLMYRHRDGSVAGPIIIQASGVSMLRPQLFIKDNEPPTRIMTMSIKADSPEQLFCAGQREFLKKFAVQHMEELISEPIMRQAAIAESIAVKNQFAKKAFKKFLPDPKNPKKKIGDPSGGYYDDNLTLSIQCKPATDQIVRTRFQNKQTGAVVLPDELPPIGNYDAVFELYSIWNVNDKFGITPQLLRANFHGSSSHGEVPDALDDELVEMGAAMYNPDGSLIRQPKPLEVLASPSGGGGESSNAAAGGAENSDYAAMNNDVANNVKFESWGSK
jgi:hypothetical protein